MKKLDVLQLAIVLVGIIFGFLTLQYLFSSLLSIFIWLFSGGYGSENLLPGISFYVIIGVQTVSCLLLITKSGKLAAYLYEKSELGTGFKIVSNIQSLLYVVIIAIGIYLLILNLNPLISAVIKSFKDRVANDIFQQDQRPINWVSLVTNVLLPAILLILAKPIAGYFAKNIGEEPVTFEDSFNKEDNSETTED